MDDYNFLLNKMTPRRILENSMNKDLLLVSSIPLNTLGEVFQAFGPSLDQLLSDNVGDTSKDYVGKIIEKHGKAVEILLDVMSN